MTMYSFIIPYRDRKHHLDALLPKLKAKCDKEHLDYEIILVEQLDHWGFKAGVCHNIGFKHAAGDVIVCHHVDHVPTENSQYWDGKSDVFLPLGRCVFLNENGTELPRNQITKGREHYADAVDDSFYGGIVTFTRKAFEEINGYNPMYCGWGIEDDDVRERVKKASLKVKRATPEKGVFEVLYHPDTNPGIHDKNFQYNVSIFSDWEKYAEEGYRTTTYDEVRTWKLKNDFAVTHHVGFRNPSHSGPRHFYGFGDIEEQFVNTPDHHTKMWNEFKRNVNRHSELKMHRDWVVQHRWGYGNRAYHYMWNYLFQNYLNKNSTLLEIGVFKGQVLSLWAMLDKAYQGSHTIYGITPLDNTDNHPVSNYGNDIQTIFAEFKLDMDNVTIIEGLSTASEVIECAKEIEPLDLLYIDGGHDYDVVKSDLANYCPLVKSEGIVVIDDACNDMNIPNGLMRMDFRGIPDVTKATKEYFDSNPDYKLLFTIGHNRIYQKN